MNYEWLSLIANWEFVLAVALLGVASFIHFKATKNKLLLVASLGFALAIVGKLYSAYLNYFSRLPEDIQGIQATFAYINLLASIASLITALGLTVAGVSYLFFALKK